MNAAYLQLHNAANGVVTDHINRSKIIASAIALAVASAAVVPSTEVENPTSHFLTQVQPTLSATLSGFNENLMFDLRSVIDQIRQLWMLRYNAAHPLRKPVFSMEYGFFDTLFGVGTYVEQDQHAFLNTHKKEIIFLSRVVQDVIAELAPKNG